jgi:inhibitor of the pro-sigma K processing machinery
MGRFFTLLEAKWWLLAGVLGILLFMFITRSVKEPFKWMGYGVLYTAVGGLVLFLLNLAGRYIQLEIPINPITAFITGVLGLPGVVYLSVVKFIFITS